MKVLICGSRNWLDHGAIGDVIERLPNDATVITGMAEGVDDMARYSALRRGLFVVDVPVLKTHWDRHGRSAGHKRNHVMLDLCPDLVIAFQRSGSAGTQGTIDGALRRGIPVEVHTA